MMSLREVERHVKATDRDVQEKRAAYALARAAQSQAEREMQPFNDAFTKASDEVLAAEKALEEARKKRLSAQFRMDKACIATRVARQAYEDALEGGVYEEFCAQKRRKMKD
jgi:hypothetical protein